MKPRHGIAQARDNALIPVNRLRRRWTFAAEAAIKTGNTAKDDQR